MTSRTLRASALTLAGAACLAGFALAGARAEVKDAGRRAVMIADTSRIVAIGGDVTEILYALKAEGKIAAVDSTSQFPAQALKEKPNVGYMRALSAEGVLSANPTLIVASKDAGPPDVVAALKASAVPYVEVPDNHTPEGVSAKIRSSRRSSAPRARAMRLPDPLSRTSPRWRKTAARSASPSARSSC